VVSLGPATRSRAHERDPARQCCRPLAPHQL